MHKNVYFLCVVLCFLFVISALFFASETYASVLISSDPVISRNVPAYTSDDCFGTKPASLANNSSYADYWRSCNASPSVSVPVTLTYDLSGIAASSRQNVILAWYNDPVTGVYNHILNSTNAYNIPGDYTIQVNAGAGGGSPPSSGWVTLATVTNNPYHSRQHSLTLTGYNWVRLSVTRSEGSVSNLDVALNMDIHDVSSGVADDWMFYGDSISQQVFLHTNLYGGTFSQVINGFNASYFPIYESGAVGGFTSTDGVNNINTWLPLFSGKFVVLAYGTNDANSLFTGATFYNNMKTLVQAVINAGKVPVIPTIPWGCTANITSDVQTLNTQITQLYSDFPAIIKGPDLYTFFNNHQSDISNDCIHPTDPAGYTDLLTQWTNTMETAVYSVPTVTISPAGGTVSSATTVTLSSAKTGTTIYYTTDGTTPTTSSTVYSSALTVSTTQTVKALAVDQAGNQSDVVSNTYTFPAAASSSISSSNSVSDPNTISGWSAPIMVGPHHVGSNSFIQTDSQTGAFIDSSAVHDDIHVSIQKQQPINLETAPSPVAFPWAQGLNTAGDIYQFKVTSAFNGYPIASFDKPVTIIVPFHASELPNGQIPLLAWYNPDKYKWEILPNSVINWQARTVATTVKKFSYFAVVYRWNGLSFQQEALGESTALQNVSAALKVTPKLSEKHNVVRPSSLPLLKKKCFLFLCW